ncbi:MAG: NAD(P)/FAD-dependent oxidoreductase [Luminiphilus sp.]
MIPGSSKYIVVGAGIHGLSTAFHLAQRLQNKGGGSGRDILILDKAGLCAGATGIACGVIRNNYYQPAMRELMAHSVKVWESDPQAYSYHPVGYMQISCESMREDVAAIHQQQQAIGYDSVFVEGAAASAGYMKTLFSDWRAQGITSVLHEKPGGYANNSKAMLGLAAKVEALGVRILTGVEVMGVDRDAAGAVSGVDTDRGKIACDYLVVAAGPWVPQFWSMLDLPNRVSIRNPATGELSHDIPMWVYWSLQEGTLGVDPKLQVTNDGAMPPVLHVDTDAPLYSDEDGRLITDQLWGIYYKPDFHFGGVQGGAAPFIVDKPAEAVAVDPYGPASPEFVVGPEFADMWVSALAHCQERFSGTATRYKKEPSGGIGAFTPDSFPVFDEMIENCFVIADSNHGYKMIGVGDLVAGTICGEPSTLLAPFAFSRYERGELHPVSNSPFPWS